VPLSDDTPDDVVERFRQDAQRAATLDHPHLVQVHRFGVTDTALWYAMEYAGALARRPVAHRGSHGPENLPAAGGQIASALEYGHRRGVTHGNVKPSNVLVDPEGWARIADFGVNRVFGALPRRQPELSFEENYGHVAPEQFGPAGEAGPGADQYALAVLTFSCLARRAPFVGETWRRSPGTISRADAVARRDATRSAVTRFDGAGARDEPSPRGPLRRRPRFRDGARRGAGSRARTRRHRGAEPGSDRAPARHDPGAERQARAEARAEARADGRARARRGDRIGRRAAGRARRRSRAGSRAGVAGCTVARR
jgi:serine/threonine protein kinase